MTFVRAQTRCFSVLKLIEKAAAKLFTEMPFKQTGQFSKLLTYCG